LRVTERWYGAISSSPAPSHLSVTLATASLDPRGGEGAGGQSAWSRKTPSLFKDRRIVRLGQISRYGDDLAICLARNLGRCCFQRLPATRADRNTPSVVACPQNRASRVHELPKGLLKIPGVSRDRDQRHQTRPGKSDAADAPIPGPPWPVRTRRSNWCGRWPPRRKPLPFQPKARCR